MFAPLDEQAVLTRYRKRLAIVVPYRDRPQHISQFLPHMLQYFERDKLDCGIEYSIHIIEQHGKAPFNRGKLLNCGFAVARDAADYFCFHDVDYLPIWTDYSWAANPARLIWHGLAIQENRERFFGGVVLFDKKAFLLVNGYSNDYWGWGYEDADLRLRCIAAGLEIEHRDGTYANLPHPNRGWASIGVPTDEAKRTLALFQSRQDSIAASMQNDGLSNLKYDVLSRGNMTLEDKIASNIFHYRVDIG